MKDLPAPDFIPVAGQVVLRSGDEWWFFERPRQIVAAWTPAEVRPALAQIEQAVEREGLYAAGLLSYEAAPAFDDALKVRPQNDFPLLWFGLYDSPRLLPEHESAGEESALPQLDWQPSVEPAAYGAAIEQIKDQIARGNTYQVNYTLRLRASSAFQTGPIGQSNGSPEVPSPEGLAWRWFRRLAYNQQARYAAYLDLGDWAVASSSPELFFQLDGERITAKPMKGTTRRGLTLAEDRAQAAWLEASEKNRAENLMIVDMLRNDLGRVARTGSVQVPRLFEAERYPTVWQMTSTVCAETGASFGEIMAALFPCASITGAPKARTMQIIRDLETTPRRIYTGCIGYWAPGRQAQFNVAIRTLLFDRRQERVEYGMGGGIIWDSTTDDEYAECLLKARVLHAHRPRFELLESLRWTPQEGYFLLEGHLQRLAGSAEYFGFPCELERAAAMLAELALSLSPLPHKVRLLLNERGQMTAQAEVISLPDPAPRLRVALAGGPLDRQDPFLYHKTSHRPAYAQALAAHRGCDDVLLWNEDGELTETCFGNIALRLGGELLTPPVECGLLAGVLRAEMLARGELRLARLTRADLSRAEQVYRLNSVRGVQQVEIV